MAVLIAEKLFYEYPGTPAGTGVDGGAALSGVSLSLEKGRCIVILGPNGAGKTTLLKLLAGLLKPSSGRTLIYGKDAYRDAKEVVGKTGLLFQDPDDQIFLPTVEEDVAFGPVNLGRPPGEVREVIEEVMESVGISHLTARAPHHLSYGEKKRVALAGLLAMSPGILLLDEPTSNLDPEARAQLLDLLKSTGKSMVVATHDVDAAAVLADRILVLNRTVLGEGEPHDIFADRELLNKARLRAPVVFSIFSRMKKAGIHPGKVPITEEEAVRTVDGMGKIV